MQGDPEGGLGGGGEQPPIIIKKVIAGGGHHGGAWKVAFADFVTAMMALFMVLWLLNANNETREAVASYFNDPSGMGQGTGGGYGGGPGISVSKDDLGELAGKIQSAMKAMPNFDTLNEQVSMTVIGDGLRIELLETEKGMFFQSGSPSPTESGAETLRLMSDEIKKLPNRIVIEGHTDSRPYSGRQDYSNWELSVDRANSARRLLLASGVKSDQMVQVRGFADVELRTPENPEDPSNRRISLIVMYNDPQAAPTTEETRLEEPKPSPVVGH